MSHLDAKSIANAKERLEIIQQRMARASRRFDPQGRAVDLIAVSKTFDADAIAPLIEAGQRQFGENRVQESYGKWPQLKEMYSGIELHLIGPLQSNKAKEAVALFDVIETVDREKIAAALSKEMQVQGRDLPCFVQVNIGGEPQKAGIAPDATVEFVRTCREKHGLTIVGLMCIPPADEAPGPYFAHLNTLAEKAGVKELSMGMSGDFETAIEMGATQVRIGSALFGTRPPLQNA
jgi:pyridoxal phosphate enzyme (YggS family)